MANGDDQEVTEITPEESQKLRELTDSIVETTATEDLHSDILELAEPVVALARSLETSSRMAESRHGLEGAGWDSFEVYLILSNLIEDLLLTEDELEDDKADEVEGLIRTRAASYNVPLAASGESAPPVADFEIDRIYEALAQRIEDLDRSIASQELLELFGEKPAPDFVIEGRENSWADPAVVEAATNFYLGSVSPGRLRELIGEEAEELANSPVTIGSASWDLLPEDLKAIPDYLVEKLSSLGLGGIHIGTATSQDDEPVFWDIADESGTDSLEDDLSPQEPETDTTDEGEWDLAEIAPGDELEDDGDFALGSGDDFQGNHGHDHGSNGHVHQILDGELRGLDDYDGEPANELETATLALIAEGLIYAELSEIFLQDLVAEADPLILQARSRGSDWWLTSEATMAVADLVSQVLLATDWPRDLSSAEVLAHREELQKRAAIYPLDPEPEAPTRAESLGVPSVSERFDFLRRERGERTANSLVESELNDLKNAVTGHLGSNPTAFLIEDLGELLSDEQLERGRTYGISRALWREIWALGVELLLGIEAESETLQPRLDGAQRSALNAAAQSYRTDEYTEEEFLKHYDSSRWPSFGVTVDLSIFTIRDGKLQVLLIERGNHPEKGKWALPGGFVNPDESLDRAVRRELQEETGVDLEATGYLEQVKSYGYPGRDPRGSVVSTLYAALIPNDYLPEPEAADDAAKARFVPVEEAQSSGYTLAFDHEMLLRDALLRIRSKIEYSPVVFDFLDTEPFTIEELRAVYEAVWGMQILPSDFRRRISQAQGALIPVPNARGEEPRWFRGTANRFFPPLDILEVEFVRE